MHPVLLARKPIGPLASHVEMLWYCELYPSAHRKERVLPNGRFQLIINLSDDPRPDYPRPQDGAIADGVPLASSLIVGMRSRFSVVNTAALQATVGAVFRPGCARAFLDAPADAFYNENIPLDLVWGSLASSLRDILRDAKTPGDKFRKLEIALLQRMNWRLELHPAVGYGLEEFSRAPHIRRVLEVTREAGLSRRRFAQLFREQVGLTPKLYCRLRRFQRALHQIASGAPVDWVDMALAGGYCDQAHFGREFRDFSGISPGAYLASERAFMNHVPMD
jgi:AraC-like DNA-binding protein